MTYRILQHEKNTDQIRIGRVFEDASGVESSVKAITHALATYHEIAPEEFGKYWSRIAIVDADTLAVIATVYSEPEETKSRHQESWEKMDELISAFNALLNAEQWRVEHGYPEFDEDNLEDGYFLWRHLPFRRMCLSATRLKKQPLSDEPCERLALLWDTISQSSLPAGVSLSGLCALRTGCSPDNKLRFSISGEVSLDDLDKIPEEALRGHWNSDRT